MVVIVKQGKPFGELSKYFLFLLIYSVFYGPADNAQTGFEGFNFLLFLLQAFLIERIALDQVVFQ